MTNTYEENIQNFTKIGAQEARQLLETEDGVVVYIGRGSCPYCQKFVEKLHQWQKEMTNTIYYIDSSNAQDSNIADFREIFDVLTVPGLLVGKCGDVAVRCDSSMDQAAFLDMMK